tara:strand:+ start:3865 stop:4251 length:387 start_codon:yes stop_codon:yes gene_type:complete
MTNYDQVTDTVTTEPEEPPRTRMGRPKLDLDLDAITRMASCSCTKREIAYILDISEDTMKRRTDVKEAFTLGKENAKVRLRKAMFSNAIEKMNPALQIFLAKNMLGMSDQGMVNGDDQQPLPWSDDTV